MEWSIQDFGALGEIVGGIGVIASLIYLGTQIRFSARTTQAQSTREIVSQFNQLKYFDDRAFPWIELWILGRRSPLIQFQIDDVVRNVFNVFESVWIAMEAGSINARYVHGLFRRHLLYQFGGNYTREIWARISADYDPGFVAYVGERLLEIPEGLNDQEMIELMRELRDYRPEVFFPNAAEPVPSA